MGYAEQYVMTERSRFQHRVEVAIVTAAIAVQAEDPQTANHAQRSALAYLVLHSPETYARTMALGVVSNVAITPMSTDADIQFSVNSMWDAYALGGE